MLPSPPTGGVPPAQGAAPPPGAAPLQPNPGMGASAPPGAPGQAPLPPPPQKPDLGPTQEQVLAVIRDRVTEVFAMDIEVDSTIAADEENEKKSRVELLEVLNKTLVATGPIIEQQPTTAPMMAQVIIWMLRSFRVGREVEDIIEKTLNDIASAAGGQKPPSPEEIKAQADMQRSQAEIAKAKIDQQTAAQKAQTDMQATRLKTQASIEEHRMKMEQMQMEAQLEAAKLQAHVQIEGHKAQMQQRQLEQQGEMQRLQHEMSMQAMQGQATLDASRMQAQHGMQEAESANKQKTMNQQMAAAEQKAVAQESLQALGLKGGLIQGEQKLETAKVNAEAAKTKSKGGPK